MVTIPAGTTWKQWATEAGKFSIMVGSSSAEIKVKQDLEIK